MNVEWKILTNPDPRLRIKAEPVEISEITTPEYQEFADKYAEFMIKSDGVGLAATQIGLNKRIIAVLEKDGISVYANPEIIKQSETTIESEEGCLSVPGIYGIVDRAKKIRFSAINRHGRHVEFNASGYQGTIYQHEIDHINGILFIDKAKSTRGKQRAR
jgi:peptide deformylase